MTTTTDRAYGVALTATLDEAIHQKLVNWRFYRGPLGVTLCASDFGTASAWRRERDENLIEVRALLRVRSRAKRAMRQWA